ncbi:MAG: hypothetical protein ACI4EN_01960, partial [Butyrivibrio sp.]
QAHERIQTGSETSFPRASEANITLQAHERIQTGSETSFPRACKANITLQAHGTAFSSVKHKKLRAF